MKGGICDIILSNNVFKEGRGWKERKRNMLFCPNCGIKNEDKAKFCENCGTKLEGIHIVKKPIIDVKKYKEKAESLTKIQIVVLAEVLCLVLVIGMFFGMGISQNSAEAVAKRYLQAYSDQNWSRVYDMTDYPEGGLLQKYQFIELMKDSEAPQITSFEIKKDKQADSNIQKSFSVEYTVKGGGTDALQLNLMKQGEKSILFFDKWKVASDEQVVKDFCINVPAGASVAVDGIALADSEKAESRTDGMNSYYVTLFAGSHKLQVAAPWFELYETEFSAVQDEQFTASDLKLADEGQTAIQAKMQEALEKVYRAAMSGQKFSEVSGLFLDKYKASCEESYDNFVSGLHDQESYTLNQAAFTDFKCKYSYNTDHKGMLGAEMTFNYDTQYTYSYKSWRNNLVTEEETGNGNSYMSASFGYDGETYKLASISIGNVL